MKPAQGQLDLFAPRPTAREQYDAATTRKVELNSTVEPQDEQRLSEQHHAILEALQDGPKTNLELGMICQRFGARLHELRRAGYRITKRGMGPGIYEYRLIGQ